MGAEIKNIKYVFPNQKITNTDLSDQFTDFDFGKFKDSKLNLGDFNKMTLQEIYNFIKCLTDPYPNAFLEDNKLIFKNVSYIPSKK
ncbi:hypothetical protein [Flavobacterium ammonificans]|uniref:hypothetical protein n=1 Tax=Flavobacterium ammonificans TaxID=1751056 RepID=UPI001E5F67B6|nr:hypothetical protein [Flavobacterium ammonificans]BDB56761.1 hypothetical protein SHINM13_10570 [Flavobacterium ammonificans]